MLNMGLRLSSFVGLRQMRNALPQAGHG